MPDDKALLPALQAFADSVSAKMNTLTVGEPEDQLRGPFETFMQAVGEALVLDVVCTGETKLEGRLGRPDYAIHSRQMLTGYAELKAPGKGANGQHFKGHDRKQFKRFSAIPNLLYTDGNEWALYREGKTDRPIVRLSGDIATEGAKAVTQEDAAALTGLLTDFMQWEPTIPCKRGGTIDLKAFAKMLAPLAHMLREDVKEALHHPESPLVALAKDWRELLFPDADDDRFADEYAQTVTFALLLARSENADPLTLTSAETTLADGHSLLARALQLLTEKDAQKEIAASLDLLLRVIAKVPPASLKSPREAWLFRHKDTLPLAVPDDPWMFFYEDFLAEYDPKLRKNVGAYYTPVEVVLAQVRLIDDLLTNRLGKPMGFADPEVNTLDPAVGTGTYLLAVIDHALAKVHELEGEGTVPGQAKTLAENVYGFELMAGPFAVSQLRLTLALQDWANLKGRGRPPKINDVKVYLTDTLESPNTPPPELALYLKPISDQHAKALRVKKDVPVIVCLGNPPYDRHEAADETNKARTGHWVRWGEDGEGTAAIIRDFTEPAKLAGHGKHLTGLFNLYVYFWRWALWKVFEAKTAAGPGVVSFISASSYLDGDAFCGMREHMRRQCEELWILDLGGEGRGTRQSDNVFAIKTPVAIAIAFRDSEADTATPAKVRYARIEGKRAQKLKTLGGLTRFGDLKWEDCPDDWHAPFRPEGEGEFFTWALLTDMFPWQQPGVKTHRPWVIGVTDDVLRERWRSLLSASDRAQAFVEESGRKITDVPSRPLTPKADRTPIACLPTDAPLPPVYQYGFRSFDRQSILADSRLMTRPRPDLWQANGSRSTNQVYLSTLTKHPLDAGPGATVSSAIPDMHHFRGSYGGKDVLPLYRDAEAKEPNIAPGQCSVPWLLHRDTGEEHPCHHMIPGSGAYLVLPTIRLPQGLRPRGASSRLTDTLGL